MKAACVDEHGNFKACPFRIFREEHLPITIGSGRSYTELFHPCMGEKCAAFHVGVCLRLVLGLKEVE